MSTPAELHREILDAIALELAATPKKFTYVVANVQRIADVHVVTVDLAESPDHGLEESLEGAAAWWPGKPPGHADVLSVDAERENINLRYVAPAPPQVGEKLMLYPPLFLEALADWWKNAANAARALQWLAAAKTENYEDKTFALPHHRFPWLRAAQRRAFTLPAWERSLLDGPPGTGKTTTLGTLLATFLLEHPTRRVLLLSTTNTAVDLALVSVDKALLDAGAQALRSKCKRIGHHFVASHYKGRDHLLPSADPQLVAQLAELESKRPEFNDVVAYSNWKREVEKLRARLRSRVAEVIRGSRLAAMTSCAATFSAGALDECGPFDLVVFDEASQVGLAYAGALATYGRRCVFAGDPAQLSPVVQSEHKQARRWLGRSAFSIIPSDRDDPPGHYCFLDEQSRMCAPICGIVSRLFYGRKLRVAADENAKPAWHAERALRHSRSELRSPVWILPVKNAGTWSQKYRGPIRYESAEHITSIVTDLVTVEDPADILVLTPFRAQRTLIRGMIRRAGVKNVTVSTVHKAQGSERRTVIFDPVDGNSQFLNTEDAWHLVNVALSRAKARLVVLLSDSDRQNLLFQNLTAAAREHGALDAASPHRQTQAAPITTAPLVHQVPTSDHIENLIFRADFPACANGKRIKIRDLVGEVVECTHAKLSVRDGGGGIRVFSVTHLRNSLRSN